MRNRKKEKSSSMFNIWNCPAHNMKSETGSLKHKPRIQQGLSIIELLVVMVILTILAGMAVMTYSGVSSRQRAKVAKNIMSSYRTALEMYKSNTNYSNLGGYPSETGIATYDDFYKVLSPYLSGDYKNYFDTSSFSYKSSVLDSTKLNVPTAYTLVIKPRISDPSILTATHKDLQATFKGLKL